jgi:cell division protein FtsI/penicillin-binding protein 2
MVALACFPRIERRVGAIPNPRAFGLPGAEAKGGVRDLLFALGSIRRALCFASFFLFATLAWPQDRPATTTTRSLFSQSAVEILQREAKKNGASYLLLDAQSGTLLASSWNDAEKPIPLGSLVKPFTALSYAGAHEFRYPVFECKGKSSGCWQDQPHGKLDIVSAISISCNAYFRRLAQGVAAEQLAPVARTFGLDSPDENFSNATLIGLGTQWRISPLHIARAYLELYRRKAQPGVSEILEGMRQSAQHGTGAAIDRQLKHSDALVKTGTAPCTHTPWAPADGFVLAMLPAGQPEILLLLRVHSVAGSKAAETAGQILRQMEE